MIRALLTTLAFAYTCVAASEPLSPYKASYPSDATIAWRYRTIGTGESLEQIYGERWPGVARFNRIDRRHVVLGSRIKEPWSWAALDDFEPMPLRYALAERDSQFILVSLSEQFLGAYEWGRLVFSGPISSGQAEHPTPLGTFRVTAYDRRHISDTYRIANTEIPYPMHFALRFYVSGSGVSYWIHGRDLPGVAASHGCIGLYDEAMQTQYYGEPKEPQLADASRLFAWAIGSNADTIGLHSLARGPRVLIVTTCEPADSSAPATQRADRGTE